MIEPKIAPMTSADLEEVLQIEKLSFSNPFSRELFLSELSQDVSRLYTATFEGRLIGYIDYWIILDELHLINLAVHPDFRKRGIAVRLFEKMVSENPAWRIILLEVRPSNKEARSFYEKLRFEVIGLRKYYYPDGEDALVMVKKNVQAV